MTSQNKSIQSPIRVMITDDHPVVRQGLKTMLDAHPDLEVVAEAGDGDEAVRRAIELKPDILIIDIVMPGKDGISAIQEIVRANPEARILVLTSFSEDDNILRAIRAGALGFHLKESPPHQLVESIRAIHRGEFALHPIATQKLVQEIKQPTAGSQNNVSLTPRELDVMKYLARGLSNQEIAGELYVSVRTVSTHIRNILDKLHLANRTQAALYAVEHGIAQ